MSRAAPPGTAVVVLTALGLARASAGFLDRKLGAR